MSSRNRNATAYCFICLHQVRAEDAEPVFLGLNHDVVKYACKTHDLGLRGKAQPSELTDAHLKAIAACLDVADPCEDIASEASDFEPARIHAKAMEGLKLLQAGIRPRAKKGTIAIIVDNGLVADVQTDIEGPDAPLVYVVDYDVEGNTDSEYLVEMRTPLSSLGEDGPMKTESALVTEWPLDSYIDGGSIRRLEEALARTHTEDAPAPVEDLTEHHTNVAQPTPVAEWRDPPDLERFRDNEEERARIQEQIDSEEELSPEEQFDAEEATGPEPEPDDLNSNFGSRVHHCDNCEGLYTALELQPIKRYAERVDEKGPVPSGECPECGALCYDVTQDLKDDAMMAGWAKAFSHALPAPINPADTATLNRAIDAHVTRTPESNAGKPWSERV